VVSRGGHGDVVGRKVLGMSLLMVLRWRLTQRRDGVVVPKLAVSVFVVLVVCHDRARTQPVCLGSVTSWTQLWRRLREIGEKQGSIGDLMINLDCESLRGCKVKRRRVAV
jgi:hypothetical protein